MQGLNPYKDVLKGMEFPDPVLAFFNWCKERERIRVNREKGQTYPWTKDPVFQKGRFLNTFRENDKGSKAIINFCNPVRHSRKDLIHALFFSRWCNNHLTLKSLQPSELKDPSSLKKKLLEGVQQPWYSEVYPVDAVKWQNKAYERLEACTELFPKVIEFLDDCVFNAKGNVIKATDSINRKFRMNNNFPIFMVVIDISWFYPNLIKPDSPVPTGIGAAPFLDILQEYLGLQDHHETANRMIALQGDYWPEARRKLTPVDIEYISCECRKYYSYINGTKQFKGKNLFIP